MQQFRVANSPAPISPIPHGAMFADSEIVDLRNKPFGELASRIAVLIPCFNAERYLPRALASLEANAEPHDIILVDDGSTIPIISSVPQLRANTVVIRLKENHGITAALNVGLFFAASEGYQYIARLDADDWCAPDRLEKQRTYMDANKGISILGSWAKTVDDKGKLLFEIRPSENRKRLKHTLAYRNPMVHSSLMLRLSEVIAAGGYNRTFRKAEDYELIRRMATFDGVTVLPEFLTFFQITPGGISSGRLTQIASDLRVKILYFSLWSVGSYLGVFKTALSALLTRGAINFLRRVIPLD